MNMCYDRMNKCSLINNKHNGGCLHKFCQSCYLAHFLQTWEVPCVNCFLAATHRHAAITEQRPDSDYMKCGTSVSHRVTYRESNLQPHHLFPYLTRNEVQEPPCDVSSSLSTFQLDLFYLPIVMCGRLLLHLITFSNTKHTTNLAAFLWTSDQLVA